MLIEHNRFDHNEDGFDTNSQNGDNPPPQNGACPKGYDQAAGQGRDLDLLGALKNTFDHDNNNPNVPKSGSAGQGPVGTGVSISGGRNDTVMDNTVRRQRCVGTIFVALSRQGPPCTGGIKNAPILGQRHLPVRRVRRPCC